MHFTGESKLKGKVLVSSWQVSGQLLSIANLKSWMRFCWMLVCGLRDLESSRLLAKPDLTLQSALDEACCELSYRLTIEIKGVSSSAEEKKTLAVHQEEATEEDANLPGDDDIH
ncbi:hypothetical protein E2320_020233 [Naja naja]|nr:hypothetical protein E2320_020233 [Naja naja]